MDFTRDEAMKKKTSEFVIGQEITAMQNVKNWAKGHHDILKTSLIEQVIESEEGFSYRTKSGAVVAEENVVDAIDAEKAAIRFLVERIVAILPLPEDREGMVLASIVVTTRCKNNPDCECNRESIWEYPL
jgi:hypothetical protein